MASSPPVSPATSRLVSNFGVRPSRASGAPRMHAGIDIGTSKSSREDEPIYAVKGGTVVLVSANTPGGQMAGYGNAVVIRHDGGKYALYAHMKDGSVTVAPGQTVVGGQRIGMMGNTTNGNFSPLPGESVAAFTARASARGYRSGPMNRHLHFELRTARPDGSSPFPGPYPQTPQQALFNLDPGPWFNQMGLFFSSRGAARISPGTTMDRTAATASAVSSKPLGDYEPPIPDWDVRFGLTNVELAALAGAGALVLAAVAVAVKRRS